MLQVLIVLVVSAHAWRPDHPTSREPLTPGETNVHHLTVPGNIPSEHRSYWGFGASPSASVGHMQRRGRMVTRMAVRLIANALMHDSNPS